MNKFTLILLFSALLTTGVSHAEDTTMDSAIETPAENPAATPTATPEAALPGAEPSAVIAVPAKEAPAATESAAKEAPATTETSSIKPRRGRPRVTSLSTWTVGLSSLQWNERMTVTQAGKSVFYPANFNGLGIGAQKETIYTRWGWNFGGFFGVGRAAGGGDSDSITYQKDKQAFTVFGLTPRAFVRLTSRVNLGASAFVYSRTIDWPTAAGTSVESGRKLNTTALLDMTLRIFDKWDFYQGIGPLEQGATFWRISINYRL